MAPTRMLKVVLIKKLNTRNVLFQSKNGCQQNCSHCFAFKYGMKMNITIG